MATEKIVVTQNTDYVNYGGAVGSGLHLRHSEYAEEITVQKSVITLGAKFVPGSTKVWIDHRRRHRRTSITYAVDIWDYYENPTYDKITMKSPLGPGAIVFIEFTRSG